MSEGPGRVGEPAGASHLLLEVPSAFQDLKARDPKAALAWRLAARDAFERAFADGYAAVEFVRGTNGRGAYLLVPQPRRDQREGGAGQGQGPLGTK